MDAKMKLSVEGTKPLLVSRYNQIIPVFPDEIDKLILKFYGEVMHFILYGDKFQKFQSGESILGDAWTVNDIKFRVGVQALLNGINKLYTSFCLYNASPSSQIYWKGILPFTNRGPSNEDRLSPFDNPTDV